MKVSELEGPKLDYWVAKAEGLEPRIGVNGECYTFDGKYSPSTDWSHGGPIIEREKITVYPETYTVGEIWFAHSFASKFAHDGNTPLIAAMRAYVASKFGEEVDDSQTQRI